MRRRRPEPSKIAFVLSTLALVFLYGTAVGRYKLFPFTIIQYAQDSAELVITERETLLKRRPSWLLSPARHEGSGVTRVVHDKAFAGTTLLTGFFDGGLELRLIGLDGSILRRWPVNFSSLFPDTRHIRPASRVPQTDWNTAVHGARLLPDGDLLFTFEGVGAAKLGQCGEVRWTLPRMTHHSVDLSADGTAWIPALRHVESDTRFPGLRAPFDEDTILKVSSDGKVLDEISVLDVFEANDLRALLFANGLATTDIPGSHTPTHLNDVEELPPALAAAFPQFSPGDLLLSVRNYNLLMVIDPKARVVKWRQLGPWLKQHDPDFVPDGTITVFSNNSDGTEEGSILGGSTILDLQPGAGRATVRYGAETHQKFFTNVRGMHQRLPNGNELITEAHAGHVFEVTPDGEIVWEYVNRYDPGTVAIITGATRYSDGYFSVSDWGCP